MSQKIEFNGIVYAHYIPANYKNEGIQFFTTGDYSQQLAYMSHPCDKIIKPHIHQIVDRNVSYTQEVLIVRKGKVRVDFYTKEQTYIKSMVISDGDVILLANGGHGFKVLESVEMIEVKQGPYLGDQDKIRFDPIDDSQVKWME